MSVKCPSCGFESPDGATWCDFCKEPFNKKPKTAPPPVEPPAPAAAAPAPAVHAAVPVPPSLAGLTKEQLETLAVDGLLKPELEPVVGAPSWLRPLAWAAFALSVIAGTAALFALQRRYRELPPPGALPPAAVPSAPAPEEPPPSGPTTTL